MNMKRNIARTLALMLVLCTLLSQTALAATTYYVDVTITGPDADGVERTLRTRLDGQKEPTVSLHCDKTVAVDEVVKVMNIAKDNNYKLILATSPK